jgi:nucleoside-diphosphate-sugar epimerase
VEKKWASPSSFLLMKRIHAILLGLVGLTLIVSLLHYHSSPSSPPPARRRPLIPLPIPVPPAPPLPTLPVLVLGSGGLVGMALVRHLMELGYNVSQVKSRADMDLRRPQTIRDMIAPHAYHFVFFLACEIGGAKFLSDAGQQEAMVVHNDMIYSHVFPWLNRTRLPFIFTSSQLVSMPTAYGHLKLKGEERTAKAGGKTVRFWNVYGSEAIGLKSHVLADWVFSCLQTGRFSSRTDGQERRFFTHADDIARALVLLMIHYRDMPPVLDLTQTTEEVSLREAGHILEVVLPTCKGVFLDTNASHVAQFATSARPTPSPWLARYWNATISMQAGLMRLIRYYMGLIQGHERARRAFPYLSVVMTLRDDHYGGDSWQRFSNGMRFFAHYAHLYLLSYELIVVEYNKRANDTFLYERRAAWPNHTFTRILTIPHAVHQSLPAVMAPDNPDRVWEYVGKNAGARVARGQYLLFMNPDNFLSPGWMALLARQVLNPRAVYRATRYDLPINQDFSTWTADQVAAQWQHRPRLLSISNTDEAPTGRYFFASGDFTMVHRDMFMTMGGYPEIPYNKHMDSLGLDRFLCGGYPARYQVVLEYSILHQEHTRPNRPGDPDWTQIFLDWPCSRRQTGDWGFANDSRTFVTEIDTL